MPCPDATHVNSMLNSGATDEETPRHKDCEIDPLEDLTTRVAPDEVCPPAECYTVQARVGGAERVSIVISIR